MPADPRPGLNYRQEYYEGEAEDRASVVSISEQAEVPAGHYRPALMTRDENPLEPKVLEFKFFAKGVGPVLAVGVSGGADREELSASVPGRGGLVIRPRQPTSSSSPARGDLHVEARAGLRVGLLVLEADESGVVGLGHVPHHREDQHHGADREQGERRRAARAPSRRPRS